MKQIIKKGKNRYFHYQKEILNTITETAWFIDKNYRFLFVNSAFNNFFNKKTNEVIGKTINEFWENDDFTDQILPAMNYCMQGKPVFLLYEGKTPIDDYKILEMNFYPHQNTRKKIDGIITTAKDVTEHKKAEQALLESEAILKDLNATKDKLFSIIGHDLKGPLNNILGFSELIDREFDNISSEEIKKYNQFIYKSSKTITELLENLLTWSRAQRNILAINPQLIPIYFTVESGIGLLMQNALNKAIKIKNNVLPDVVAYADEEMVTIIIRNLVSNAIKFTKRGGEININAQQTDNHVIVSISDTGIGITPDHISQLFKPHENHSFIGTEGEKGTGLGLIICKDFVERNNGKIWVESDGKNGTTFFVMLPMQNQE